MTRVLSGVVLAAVALAAILFLPPIGVRILACVVAGLAAHEYLRIVGGDRRFIVLVVVVCWLLATGSLFSLALVSLLAFAGVAMSVLFSGHTGPNAAASAFALLYVGMPLGMLVAVHARGGPRATLLLIATVVVSDSMQYYTGRTFGRRPLAPAISPKKTLEGAIGGILFGTVFMAIVGARVLLAAPVPMAVLGLVIVLLGIAGDLFESRLKRQANLKDSSALIPGHGGVLDRIDALLFAIPAFYLYLYVSLRA
jgi:phosphatidate cytidylyltransferase